MPRTDHTYVALLRGINVGGKNVIPMVELRDCFEQIGAKQVTTYIQSGNVLFRSSLTSLKKLVSVIETALSESFSYQARVVVVKKEAYLETVAAAHKSWGSHPDSKHNAMFLVDQMDADEMLSTFPKPKRGIDTVSTGNSVIFWSADQAMITKSSMMQVAKLPAYKQMTVRNHKTTRKLAELLNEFA